MYKILVSPPVAFLIVFFFLVLLNRILKGLSFKGAKFSQGKGEAYACGEDIKDHMAQPDYSQFFPFAFFFTIAHVATLMLTTLPVEDFASLVTAFIYLVGIIISLFVLFRR